MIHPLVTNQYIFRDSTEHAARMGERTGVYRGLVGKPEGKRPLGWEDNIKMDLQEVVCEGIDWIILVQDRDRLRAHLNGVVNLQVPLNVGNFLTGWKLVSFSRRTMLHGISGYTKITNVKYPFVLSRILLNNHLYYNSIQSRKWLRILYLIYT